REEIIKKEPQLSDQVISGLWLPSTGILYPWEIAIALMENAISNGVDLKLDEEVIKIEKIDQGYRVKTKNQTIDTKIVINCSGVYADDLYATLIQRKDFSITARKGEYFVLDHMKKPYVNHVLYPVPSKIGKGVLVVPTIHDNILLGPTSYEVDDKYAINNTQKGLDFVRGQLSKIVKDVPMDKLIRTFAGNRPSGNTKDFIIEE
ncbi:NAD(P)/FAD-dependent oxidoreductase, partial [Anaerorhabdus sp.]